jgi:hypothetical protein
MVDLLDVDGVDAKLDEVLTMTVLPLRVVLAALLLENDDLLAAGLAENRSQYRSAGDRGSADPRRRIAADHQHFAERDFVLIGRAEDVAFDAKELAFGNAVLLSSGTDDGVHENLRKMDPPFTTGDGTRQNFVDKTLIPF